MGTETAMGAPGGVVLGGIVLAGVIVFVIGSLVRAVRYARYPMHLRWELYPVPHEAAPRARYGGSRFEETDWWTRPVETDQLNAARSMAKEIVLLRGLWEANRPLWYRSFPFHLGLYLVSAATGLFVLGAVVSLVVPGSVPGTALALGSTIAGRVGTLGLVLALIGAVALLHARLTSSDLRPYTTPGDLFNLSAFIVAFGCLLGGVLLAGSAATDGIAVTRAILTLKANAAMSSLLGVGLALSALVAAYIPFTHMAHFVGKYFTYHAVRWDDEPNVGAVRIERAIAEYLAYRPTWSARHVGADGTKTWGDVATTAPAGEVPK